MKKILSKNKEERLNQLLDLPLNYLTVEDYNNLKLNWIQEYAKRHNFYVKDVFYCLGHLFYEKSEDNLLFKMKKELDIKDKVSIGFLQRYLCCSYNKASFYIDNLLKDKIIKKQNDKYVVVLKNDFKKFLTENKNQII